MPPSAADGNAGDRAEETVLLAAQPEDAAAIAEIHLSARREAMPYLRLAHSDAETRAWFTRTIGENPAGWWVARAGEQIVGYMLIAGDSLDHLYVLPGWQGRGVGTALLGKAKLLSSGVLWLWTFRRNINAQRFYENRGFVPVAATDGDNEENEPDIRYEWRSGR